MVEIKTKFFKLLESLNYRIKDNPYAKDTEETFPCLKLSVIDAKRGFMKDGGLQTIVTFQVDIFSQYDGEKEVLEIEQKIAELVPALYDIESVQSIAEIDFKIIDDTSLKVRMKHGILRYKVLMAGQIVEVAEQEEENNG